MITRQKAVDMSIKKWEALAGGKGDVDADCGFCQYVYEKEHEGSLLGNERCKNCPLFPDICANINYDENDNDLVPEPLFWQYCHSEKDTSIAQQILDAIKTRGQAWIEEETK